MSATLTERYISATIRSLPAESQEDVRAELAASIADAVEARTEQGEDPGAAEHEVLTGLGAPAGGAAGGGLTRGSRSIGSGSGAV